MAAEELEATTRSESGSLARRLTLGVGRGACAASVSGGCGRRARWGWFRAASVRRATRAWTSGRRYRGRGRRGIALELAERRPMSAERGDGGAHPAVGGGDGAGAARARSASPTVCPATRRSTSGCIRAPRCIPPSVPGRGRGAARHRGRAGGLCAVQTRRRSSWPSSRTSAGSAAWGPWVLRLCSRSSTASVDAC